MIALATCEELPDLDPDDAPLLAALRERGLDPRPVVWTDPGVDWAAFEVCLIRSVWDYFLRLEEFLAWVDRAGAATTLLNPPATVRWNADKRYLRELAAAGVATIPTAWVARGERPDLGALLAEHGWEDAVLKPTVGGGSLGLHQVGDHEAAQAHLEEITAGGDAMVQPFLTSIGSGELSILFVDGEPAHAVRKTPRPGDIRVQPEHGGSVQAVQPTAEELELARRALEALVHPALYARADIVRGPVGEPLLIELECIEPRFFLEHGAGTADRIAAAVARRLG